MERSGRIVASRTTVRSTFALLLLVLAGGVLAPTAAAEQLQANVVSWSPNDVRPGEPVSVVLKLYTAGPSPYPEAGIPVAGVSDVAVAIYRKSQARRFTTKALGSGRYRTEIVFPEAGGWNLRVQYAAGSHGPGAEILLGKGAICVGGQLCVDEQGVRSARATGHVRRWMHLAFAVAVVLIVAVVAAAERRLPRGRRSRLRRTA
jgi:hypothetical protein